MALLIVLVLVTLSALGCYGYTFHMQNQYRRVRIQEAQVHARLAAHSGLDLVAAILEQPVDKRSSAGSLLNNPGLFRDIPISPEDSRRPQGAEQQSWRFSVLSPSETSQVLDQSPVSGSISGGINRPAPTDTLFRFGLENESAKIHVPTLLEWDKQYPGHAQRVLMQLPGANQSIVQAWLISMNVLPLATQAVTGSSRIASTVSEQPTITEMTVDDEIHLRMRDLWLGGDWNQDYRIDLLDLPFRPRPKGIQPVVEGFSQGTTDGNNVAVSPYPSESQGIFSAWQRYLTWHSGSRNESASGRRRVDLNQANLQELHRRLLEIWPAAWADFVVIYRQFGASKGAPVGSGSGVSVGSTTPVTNIPLDFSVGPRFTLRSPLELVGVTVTLPATPGKAGEKSNNRQVPSPFGGGNSEMSNYLGKLLDDVTTQSGSALEGRVDIRHAPLWTLMAIPGVDAALAQQILQRRSAKASDSNEASSTVAWLLEEGVVDLRKMTQIEPYLTARSDVYSCQVVGYFDDRSPMFRCSATLVASSGHVVRRCYQQWHPWGGDLKVADLRTELAVNRQTNPLGN